MLKKIWLISIVFFLFLSGCKLGEENLPVAENSVVKVTIADVADADLKKTAEALSEAYRNKPKNSSASVYQNLTPKALQDLVGEDLDLSGLHEISARQIGDDYFYILMKEEDDNLNKFTIYKNNEAVFSFKSEPLTQYSPIVSVRVIENKYTVEFLEKMYSKSLNKFLEKKGVWQDGVGKIVSLYALQNAMMPFEANGKMLFLGQKNDVWKIYYAGEELPYEFSSINFGYSYEPSLYMPKAFNYRYLVFFATQNEKSKVVEVDVGGE